MYITHCLIGFALAVVFTAALIGLNVANLRYLVTHVSGGWLAALMLVLFNSLVFAGVQFAIAVMRMAEDDETPRGGNRAPDIRPQGTPVRVAATAARRPR